MGSGEAREVAVRASSMPLRRHGEREHRRGSPGALEWYSGRVHQSARRRRGSMAVPVGMVWAAENAKLRKSKIQTCMQRTRSPVIEITDLSRRAASEGGAPSVVFTFRFTAVYTRPIRPKTPQNKPPVHI
eukprot:2849294-Prymnesium_polylepis.1